MRVVQIQHIASGVIVDQPFIRHMIDIRAHGRRAFQAEESVLDGNFRMVADLLLLLIVAGIIAAQDVARRRAIADGSRITPEPVAQNQVGEIAHLDLTAGLPFCRQSYAQIFEGVARIVGCIVGLAQRFSDGAIDERRAAVIHRLPLGIIDGEREMQVVSRQPGQGTA